MRGPDLLQHLPWCRREELLAGQHLEEDRAQAEQFAAVVGPHLHHHLGGHVRGLARHAVVPGAASRGDAEVDQLDRPFARHHHVARADVAVDDAGPLEDVLEAPAHPARDEHAELDVGRQPRPRWRSRYSMSLQPSMYSRTMQAPRPPVEIEDAADVLVVEDGERRASSTKSFRWWGSGVLSCLTTIGRWKPDSPRSRPL